MIVDPAVSVHYISGSVHKQFVEGFKSKNIDYDILLRYSEE